MARRTRKRGGTENTASIVALGKAAELASSALQEENSRVKKLRDRFEQGLLATVSSVQVNGHRAYRLPNTSSLAIEGIDSEGMLMLLDQRGICCSAGSACTAGSLEPSHVLRAMGYSNERARGSLRFSFSRFNSETGNRSGAADYSKRRRKTSVHESRISGRLRSKAVDRRVRRSPDGFRIGLASKMMQYGQCTKSTYLVH